MKTSFILVFNSPLKPPGLVQQQQQQQPLNDSSSSKKKLNCKLVKLKHRGRKSFFFIKVGHVLALYFAAKKNIFVGWSHWDDVMGRLCVSIIEKCNLCRSSNKEDRVQTCKAISLFDFVFICLLSHIITRTAGTIEHDGTETCDRDVCTVFFSVLKRPQI